VAPKRLPEERRPEEQEQRGSEHSRCEPTVGCGGRRRHLGRAQRGRGRPGRAVPPSAPPRARDV